MGKLENFLPITHSVFAMTPKIKKYLHDLISLAEKSNASLYLVGGTVRDSLLQRAYSDYDFTSSRAVHIARVFSEKYPSKLVPLDDTPGRQTYRVALGKKLYFDFSQMQGNTLEEDLGKRDFTINAMGLALPDFLENDLDKIVDPYDGRQDLKDKVLRVLPGSTFPDDPLRMIRAFRFAHTLGFKIEPQTLAEISRHKSELTRIAGERISYELMILLNSPKTQIGLMHRSGLLEVLFPECQALSGENNTKAIPGVWEKSLMVMDALDQIFSSGDATLKNYRPGISKFLSGNHHRPLIRLAGLLFCLHQSPTHISYKKSGSKTSLTQVLKKLRLSNSAIRFVDRTLFFSLHLVNYGSDVAGKDIGESQIYALIKECDGELISSILLAAAMVSATSYNKGRFYSCIERFADFYFNKYLPAKKNPALLSGDTLESKFKLAPSSSYKIILDKVEEARVLGNISTHKEAEEIAKALIKNL